MSWLFNYFLHFNGGVCKFLVVDEQPSSQTLKPLEINSDTSQPYSLLEPDDEPSVPQLDDLKLNDKERIDSLIKKIEEILNVILEDPISLDKIRNPEFANDGFTYERGTIESLTTSPMTDQQISIYVKNEPISALIELLELNDKGEFELPDNHA